MTNIEQPHPNQSIYVNILLLGTSEAGKYTIAKHIASDDDFPVREGVYYIPSGKYRFVLIDTAGARLDCQRCEERSISILIRKEV